MSRPPVLRLRGVSHGYSTARGGRINVLDGVDLDVDAGSVVGLTGPSGSGKSTLLHIAGLLETPESGGVEIDGEEYVSQSERARTLVRRSRLGFVYQFHHLLPELSAIENIAAPLAIAGVNARQARARAETLLDVVGLSERAHHRPGQLSGGEQQRTAIARAMANRPSVLIADEPTGNLDPERSAAIFSMLVKAARAEGGAIMVATHDLALCVHMDAVYRLQNGSLMREDGQ